MILQILAVFDDAVKVFGKPIFVPAIGGATRELGDHVNSGKENDPMCSHPEDFSLWHLGEYDDSGAEFKLFDSPRRIVGFGDMVKSK